MKAEGLVLASAARASSSPQKAVVWICVDRFDYSPLRYWCGHGRVLC